MRVKRHWAIAVLGAAALAAIGASGAGAGAARAQACFEGEDTTKSGLKNGKLVDVFCGPASATLTYKGKTYPFKNGTCRKDTLEKGDFRLELGSTISGRHVTDYPAHMIIYKPGSSKSHFQPGVSAEAGPRNWAALLGATITLTGNGGTFKSTTGVLNFAGKVVDSHTKLSGEFKCR
jgi:hypothetical protein